VTHRSVEVPVVARVEGEGALHVRVEDDVITRLELEIYEPPRFFEAFLEGRHFSEVPDIVPRICGICPVAYQMSAIHGLERLFETEVPAGTHELRRMLFLGEWIESHVLHIHLLALPDYLGFHDAIELAQNGFQAEVERALKMKRLGNDVMEAMSAASRRLRRSVACASSCPGSRRRSVRSSTSPRSSARSRCPSCPARPSSSR
jgi:sulfhydrogenase subunit alpha